MPETETVVTNTARASEPNDPRRKSMYSHDRWDQLLAKTTKAITDLALLKGGEYSGDKDRLANFRRNGQALNLPMQTIWAVYAGKHWDAIQQYVKDLQVGKLRNRLEPISSRCDDLIVYLILFKAMEEEHNAHLMSAQAATKDQEGNERFV